MNTTLSTPVGQHSHPPQSVALHVARHVSLVDRVALRVGLALITWSRRPSSASPSHHLVAQRIERDRTAEHRLRLNLPQR